MLNFLAQMNSIVPNLEWYERNANFFFHSTFCTNLFLSLPFGSLPLSLYSSLSPVLASSLIAANLTNCQSHCCSFAAVQISVAVLLTLSRSCCHSLPFDFHSLSHSLLNELATYRRRLYLAASPLTDLCVWLVGGYLFFLWLWWVSGGDGVVSFFFFCSFSGGGLI